MPVFTLAISCLTTSNLPWFMDQTFQVSMQYCLYSIGLYFHHQSHQQLGIFFFFLLCLCLSILSGGTSPLFSSSILGTYWPGEFIFQFHIFCLFINWIKDLLSVAPPARARLRFPHSQPSPCHQEASTSLLFLSIRGQREWKPQLQKINQTDHLDHSLV